MNLHAITFLICTAQAYQPQEVVYHCGKCGQRFESYYALKVHRREVEQCYDPVESVVINVVVDNKD